MTASQWGAALFAIASAALIFYALRRAYTPRPLLPSEGASFEPEPIFPGEIDGILELTRTKLSHFDWTSYNPTCAGSRAGTLSEESTLPQAADTPSAPQATGLSSKDATVMERRKEELARMSDAEFLRDLVDDGTPGKFTDDGYEVMLIGDLTKARLSALADALETDEKVLAGSGDVIADLIKSMSDALAHPTFLDPEERDNVERWHAALLASEVDANRRIAEAGHHASQMEAQRDRAVALVDEQKRYIRQLQGAIISLLEDLERAEAEPEIVFVFVENDPSAMGIEIAADIMLAVESFTTAGLSKK